MKKIALIISFMLMLFLSFGQRIIIFKDYHESVDTSISSVISSGRILFNVIVGLPDENRFLPEYKYGYFDSNDHVVIPAIYDFADDFRNGLAIVGQKDPNSPIHQYYQWHILPNGEKLYQQKYVDVLPFNGNYAIADKDGGGHMCHIDKTGKPLYPQTYKWLYNFNGNSRTIAIRAFNSSKNTCLWVVIDLHGKEIYSIWSGDTTMEGTYPEVLDKYLYP